MFNMFAINSVGVGAWNWRTSSVFLALLILVVALASIQVVEGQSEVTIEPANPAPLAAGDQITLTCKCPVCETLLWYLNGMEQSQRPGVVISEMAVSGMTSLLTLENVDETLSGQWKCADPDDYFQQTTVTLTVEASGGEIEIEIYEPKTPSMHVAEGGDINLQCRGPPDIGLEWLHNGMHLRENVERVSITDAFDVESGYQKSLMTRRNSVATDGGQYVCRDSDDIFRKVQITVNIGQPASETHPVEIIEPSSSSMSVSPGRSFTLKCVADENTQLVWYYGEQSLDEGMGFQIQVAQDSGLTTGLLTKEDATESDSGQYVCVNEDNQHDKAAVTVTVTDEVPPVEPDSTTSVYRMKVGTGKVTLDCIISGSQETEVTWSKDRQTIEANDKYSITTGSKSSRLDIRNPEKEDAGSYQCLFTDIETQSDLAIMNFDVITVDCPKLTAPENGSFAQCPENPVYGQTCSFQCESGLKLTYSKALVCQLDELDADWDHDVPKCRSQSFIDKFLGGSGSHVQATIFVTCFMAYVTLAAILY